MIEQELELAHVVGLVGEIDDSIAELAPSPNAQIAEHRILEFQLGDGPILRACFHWTTAQYRTRVAASERLRTARYAYEMQRSW